MATTGREKVETTGEGYDGDQRKKERWRLEERRKITMITGWEEDGDQRRAKWRL
jgi:hypothetical protein